MDVYVDERHAERKTVAELCGGDIHNALADLLPRGADVYALGVQE